MMIYDFKFPFYLGMGLGFMIGATLVALFVRLMNKFKK